MAAEVSAGTVPNEWLLFEAGWAGVMACLAWLNLAWYRRARERLLLWSGVTCGAAVVAIAAGLHGLVHGAAAPWAVLVPVRGTAVGLMLAAFVLCLHSLRPLPWVGAGVAVVLASRVVFLTAALLPGAAWTLPAGATSPTYTQLTRSLLTVALAVVLIFAGLAVTRLSRRERVELAAAATLSILPVLAANWLTDWKLELVSSMWMVPLALLIGTWSGRHVLRLRGSLRTALADRDEAHRQARTDQRTGLPNVRGLGELLQSRLSARGQDESVAVLVVHVDLDAIRAQEGEVVTDALAYQAAHELRRQVPHGDVARLGGTTFCVVAPWPVTWPVRRLTALCDRRSEQFRRGAGLPPATGVHVGIAVAPEDVFADELLRCAQAAASEAHQHGRRTEVYAPHLHELQARRARLGRLLSGAVAAGEIEVHYQPVVDPRTGRRAKVEALARWRHHGRLHRPDEWIPLAESRGLMPTIGEEVLRVAARDQVLLGCPVAVNVSPGQLAAPGFVRSVLQIVGDRCARDRIILEITEDAIMCDFAQSLQVLQQLRAAGFGIALDDFGTKHSSLSRVAQLPFDVLKIDRSFVRRLGTPDGRAMVAAIQALTRALGKVSVAEGVETQAQLATLREIGCDLVQGYLTGRPEPLAPELFAPEPAAPEPVDREPVGGSPAGRSADAGIAAPSTVPS